MMKQPETLVEDHVREEMSRATDLGAGNFLRKALSVSPAPDAPILFLEKPLKPFFGKPLATLSLLNLQHLADVYGRWYKSQGIERHDTVMIYLDDGIEYLVHYLALTRLGAIGVLTNGNMEAKVAAAHLKNVGCVGVFTDSSHRENLDRELFDCKIKFLVTEEDLAGTRPADLEDFAPFTYDDDDPIMIAHSSGTTGTPKPVLLQHQPFFYGVRTRLAVPKVQGGETILSTLPHSHNCAIAYQMLALLSGTPMYIASDHRGEFVRYRINEFRPSMVVSFPQTYVELADCDLEADDFSSVNLWFNGGDAAHESHIRKLVKHGFHIKEGVRQEGSVFVDGMGSSEMGFSLFRHVHTVKSNHYRRCIGKPHTWVKAAILSDQGEILPPHTVGKLGVKAPSVTTGYWNNSSLTYKSRIRGYFLTGDLAYEDEAGYFYHVDRVPDVILTDRGPLYGLQTEEMLMSGLDCIADVAVFGESGNKDKDYGQKAVAAIRLVKGHRVQNLKAACNELLIDRNLNTLDEVRLVNASEVPLGTTGKVLKRKLRQAVDSAVPAI
jgi:acyl-coenzyme A synthetase/AMP-(fatty) acid ligase